LQYPAIRSVASSSAIPGAEIGFSYVNLIKRNLGDAYDATVYKTMFVSSDFISTYNIELLEGQTFSAPANFSGASPWETENWSSVILNESAIHQLGFKSPAEAVNQEVYFQPFGDFLKCKIIGVIKDYHHEAVKKEVFPTILFHNYATYQQVYYSVGLNAGVNPSETLKEIGRVWKASFPDRPFEYFFLDEYYDRQFKNEVQFQKIFALFAGTAIIIACLGVLGMTLFEMNTRLKEISIRKVLGASSFGLVFLLSRTNMKLILVSFALATPLIYYFTKEWLANYPAKIEFTAWLAVTPLIIVAFMVTIVSGIQTIKAAGSNPIDHLKNE
jgi:putative ABC transport system permease protein